MKSEPALQRLRVLLLEDNAVDAELILDQLRRAGIDAEAERVIEREQFEARLAACPDLILADYQLPSWTGLDALKLVRSRGLEVPFIIVSGTVGEETAIETMRHGADDYLLKDRPSRLGAALNQALERKRLRAEIRSRNEVLAQSEAALHRAHGMAKIAHVISAPDGSFETWSSTLPQLIGIGSDPMPASTREWLDLLHPEDRATFRAKAIEAGRNGARADVEYRLRRRDGAFIDVRQVMEPLFGQPNVEGKWRWFNTLQDVTEQKRGAQALQESEERFRAMFEKAAVGITHTDLQGRFVLANPKLCEFTGYTREELLSVSIRELMHPDDVKESLEFGLRLLEGATTTYEREARLLRKDRATLWVNVTTSLVRGPDGTPLYFISVVHDISERKRAELDLHRLHLAMDLSMDSIYLTDPATMRFVYVNDAACRRLGYARDRLLQMGPHEVLGTDRARIQREYEEVISAGAEGMRSESRFIRSDGSEGWTEINRRALRTHNEWLIVTIGRDITERRAQLRRIGRLSRVHAMLGGINALIVRVRERDELFREACRIAVTAGRFRMAWIGIIERDATRIHPAAWHGIGEDYIPLMPLDLGEAAPQGLAARAVLEHTAMIIEDLPNNSPAVLREKALEHGFQSLAVLPLMVAEQVKGVLALYAGEIGFFDENEMKLLRELAGDIAFAMDHIEKEQRLDYLAYYDSLTGLANRTLLLERLKQSIHACAQAGAKLALVLSDVERLRSINESFGRQVGDALLKQLAERIARTADPTEIGRISADQFAVVLPSIKGRSEVLRRVEQFSRDWFGEAFRLNEAELRISAKAGIVLFPNDGADAETLFRNAEAALIRAKQSGDRHTFYTSALTRETAERLTLENQLRQALEKNEFVLYYQPKVESDTGRIVGVEALMRWQNPLRGLVPPGQFIRLLEEIGLITDVGTWALAQAAADHLRWQQQGLAAPRVAVNVSAIQLRGREFVATVQEAFKHGATPPGVDLEMTESLLMEDIEGNVDKLRQITRLGVSIAIDDFGTGYSSLGYLAKLPVQSLKIDRSFIVSMVSDSDKTILVQTIISLAHSLRLKVVAEGVETEEQAKFLRLLRCDELQGYLFGRPLPFEGMTALLQCARSA